MNQNQTIVLTGASSGIGAALAAELAGPGVTLCLFGRNASRLEASADAARAAGASVECVTIPVEDRAGMAAWLTRRDASGGIDMIIANAGIADGLSPGQMPEADGTSHSLVCTNILGLLNTVEPLLPAMIARRSGHIVMVSSVAAIRPHPDIPTYSATKAAVRAYGVALRGWLRAHDITVTVVVPGFVTSPMSKRHVGFKPFEVTAERAASIIARGLARKSTRITFPWRLAALAWISSLLPAAISDRLQGGFAAEIRPPRD